MAVSGTETLVWQNRVALTEMGLPKADNRNMPDALKQNYLAAQAQLMTPYMTQFLSVDVRPLLAKIECPVLAHNGTKDTQVEHESNLGALRIGLKENPKNRLESIEGLNHLSHIFRKGRKSLEI